MADMSLNDSSSDPPPSYKDSIAGSPKPSPQKAMKLFEVGMRLEAVDRKFPYFVCAAHIEEVKLQEGNGIHRYDGFRVSCLNCTLHTAINHVITVLAMWVLMYVLCHWNSHETLSQNCSHMSDCSVNMQLGQERKPVQQNALFNIQIDTVQVTYVL